MIYIAITLLVAAVVGYSFYLNYKHNAQLVKDVLDQYAAGAEKSYEQKDETALWNYRELIKDYGQKHFVGRPWFGLYEYYTEIQIHVDSLQTKLHGELTQHPTKIHKHGVRSYG